jgi:hypothetical protein
MSATIKSTSNTSQLSYDTAAVTTLSASSATISGAATVGNLSITGQTNLGGILSSSKAIVYETAVAASGSGSPFTLDYSQGGVFYIPTASVPASNFSVILTNIPTDQTKVYTITLLYYQATNLFYGSTARVSDTTGSNYLLGTSSTFVAPLFNGGTPTLVSAPSLTIQQFNIISISGSRYVTSTVSPCS